MAQAVMFGARVARICEWPSSTRAARRMAPRCPDMPGRCSIWGGRVCVPVVGPHQRVWNSLGHQGRG
eukprot:5752191-Lingulodinium_polyedra.AAC.1